jgi:hypothetical protein
LFSYVITFTLKVTLFHTNGFTFVSFAGSISFEFYTWSMLLKNGNQMMMKEPTTVAPIQKSLTKEEGHVG